MAAVGTDLFALLEADGGARRPSGDDVGIGVTSIDSVLVALKDHATRPPRLDGEHPYAALFNVLAFLARSAGRMIPAAKLTIKFVAGVPTHESCKTAAVTLSASDFELVDLGTGLTAIQWLSWKLPPLEGDPMACCNENADSTATARIDPAPPANYTRILINCYRAGVLANDRFTVWI